MSNTETPQPRDCWWVRFRFVELMIVIAIIVVILALLLPAIQVSRARADRAKCESNLRQIAIGFNNYDATNKNLPDPAIAGQVRGAGLNGTTIFIQLLPYLEAGTAEDYVAWRHYQESTDYLAHGSSPNAGLIWRYRVYGCPSDSSLLADVYDTSSYCANVVAFNPTMHADGYTGTVGASTSLSQIPAGTSNVIAMAEMLYNCSSALNQIDIANSNTSFWVDVATSAAPSVFVHQEASSCSGKLSSAHGATMAVGFFDGSVTSVTPTSAAGGNNFGRACNPEEGYGKW